MPADADLVTYLDPLIAETGGTDLFEGPSPELPDNLIAVTVYATERSDDYVMSASLAAPGSELEHVQVMTRNTDKAAGYTRALAVHALLDNGQNLALAGGRTYFAIESEGPPFCLGQDSTLRWRWVANYKVRKVRG